MDPTPSLHSRISLRDYVPEDRSLAIEILRRGMLDGLDPDNRALYDTLDEWCNSVDHLYDNIPAYVCAQNGGRLFIASDENDQVVGIVGIKVPDDSRKKNRAEMVRLGVRDEFRGQKIGKFLFNFIIEYAKNDLNLSVLYLATLDVFGPAVSMYNKYGFKEVSRNSFGTEAIQIHMELNLTPAEKSSGLSKPRRLKAFIKKIMGKLPKASNRCIQ